MRIFITIPALNPPHGGLRVIIEWANRLSNWHDVTLYTVKPGRSTWMEISARVRMAYHESDMKNHDCLIITSPHTIHLQDHSMAPKKIFIFMQMLEHMFRQNDLGWMERCIQFYTSPHPLIAISQWNIDRLHSEFKRTGPVHYVGNGVNTLDFPLKDSKKNEKIVLVEGWEGYNPAKDVDAIGPAVARMLKMDGYQVFAYGQMRLKTHTGSLTSYYYRPTLSTINWLYDTATILIKASRYDARSCSPMEAMTKKTVTARAIIQGDDDLVHESNCLRCGYNREELYGIAKKLLLNRSGIRDSLAENTMRYVQQYSWDHWIRIINKILIS